MFDGKVLVKLRLDPAVVKVENMIHVEVHGFRLDLRLSVLEVSLHLITSLKQTEDVNTGTCTGQSVLTLVSKCVHCARY